MLDVKENTIATFANDYIPVRTNFIVRLRPQAYITAPTETIARLGHGGSSSQLLHPMVARQKLRADALSQSSSSLEELPEPALSRIQIALKMFFLFPDLHLLLIQ